jgi:hypothetical protein
MANKHTNVANKVSDDVMTSTLSQAEEKVSIDDMPLETIRDYRL